MTLVVTFDLDLDREWGHVVVTPLTSFYVEVKVIHVGHTWSHYPRKMLKHFRFVQNVFTFFNAHAYFDIKAM